MHRPAIDTDNRGRTARGVNQSGKSGGVRKIQHERHSDISLQAIRECGIEVRLRHVQPDLSALSG